VEFTVQPWIYGDELSLFDVGTKAAVGGRGVVRRVEFPENRFCLRRETRLLRNASAVIIANGKTPRELSWGLLMVLRLSLVVAPTGPTFAVPAVFGLNTTNMM
jgi:hypothetical protein